MKMFHSILFVSILLATVSGANSPIAAVAGITGYPALLYTPGASTSSTYDVVYTTVATTLISTYGLEGSNYNLKLYSITTPQTANMPILQFFRSATDIVLFDRDFIHQDMVNFAIRLCSKYIVNIPDITTMTSFKTNNNIILMYYSASSLTTTTPDVVTLSQIGTAFENILIGCSSTAAVLAQEGYSTLTSGYKLALYRLEESTPIYEYTGAAALDYTTIYNWVEQYSYLNALKFNQYNQEVVLARDKNVIFMLYDTWSADLATFKLLSYTYKAQGVIFSYCKKDETNIFYNSLAYYLGQNNAATWPQIVFTKARVKYYYATGAFSTTQITDFITDVLKSVPTTQIFYKSEPVPTYQSSIVLKVVGTNYQSQVVTSVGSTCVSYCRRHTCYDQIAVFESVAQKFPQITFYYLDLDFNEVAGITLDPDKAQAYSCFTINNSKAQRNYTGTSFDEATLTSFVSTQSARLLDL